MNFSEYISGMDKYIQDLTEIRKTNPEKATAEARESLKRSGILDENGKMKCNICG